MKRFQRLVWGVLAGTALLAGCQEGGFEENAPYATVRQVEDLSETIGGPGAAGTVGDYILENDKIRIIVHGRPGDTGSTAALGGSIIDADLQRHQKEFVSGGGLDQFFEFGPMINLRVPRTFSNPSEDEQGDSQDTELTVEAEAFEIIRAKANSDGGALLRVKGIAGNVVNAIELMDLVLPSLQSAEMEFLTDYELRPGESFVRITTIAYPTGIDEDKEILQMDGFEDTRSLLELILGDLSKPCLTDDDCTEEGETCQGVLSLDVCRGPDSAGSGAFGAWLALLGGKLGTFVPGAGFDPWLNLQSAVAQDLDFFSHPVPFDFLAGVGDRVSYAVFSGEGDMLVPLASSNFTIGLTNVKHCPLSDADCVKVAAVKMTAFLAVGEGDVASAASAYYDVRGIPTGRIKGVVVNAHTFEPVSGVDVFVFADPWAEESDSEVAGRSYEELVQANEDLLRSEIRPAGEAGIITHMKSDVGTDPRPDGDFKGRVPLEEEDTRRVFLVGRKDNVISVPHMVKITKDKTSDAVVILGRSGHLEFEVRDQNGVAVPAKLTIGRCMADCAADADCAATGRICDLSERRCVPKDGCETDAQCDPDEWCDEDAGICRCQNLGEVPRELGGHWTVDGVIRTVYVDAHSMTIDLAPGTYEAIFSRGLEYDIDRRFVVISGSLTSKVIAHVNRVVDTTGFVSADFHVHSSNSPDGGLPLDKRLLSFLGEGVEFISSSDHDVFTLYEHILKANGWNNWASSQVGVESSPLMLSHFLAFPVRFDENQPQNMPEDVIFDWFNKGPAEIIEMMRNAGDLDGKADAVVILPHVYDYFNYYGLKPFDLFLSPNLIMTVADPLFKPEYFTATYDGFEIANGKSMDFIRRPTMSEMRDYNIAFEELTDKLKSQELDMETYAAQQIALGRDHLGRMLGRTIAEQDAFMDTNEGVSCGCVLEEGCPALDAEDEASCNDFRGVLDDWMRMNNRGVFRTAVANSDTHGLYSVEAGMPRNYVRYSTDLPVEIDPMEISHQVRDGALVATYGPFIRFEIDGQGIGFPQNPVHKGEDEGVHLSVQVQSPLWFDVDRVEIYRNARIIRVIEGCDVVDDDEETCIAMPNDAVVNLDITFEDTPDVDSWYAVAAVGTRGKDLAPVYSSNPLARFGFVESMDSLFEVVPVGFGGGSASSLTVHSVLPFAITNPIWVEVDGKDGFTPPDGEAPDWANR